MSNEPAQPLIVRMRHVRAAKLCSRGGRQWFARYDLNWTDFLDNGIDAEALRALGDPLALRAICAAEAERDGRR